LPESLALALRSRGIHRLYRHQAEVWNAAARGDNVVVVTPTASGKSLCYTLPVIASAMRERGKTLYLFPTKALAQDQVADLIELSRAGALGIRAATFDGDTPGDQRRAIRLNGDIVVSNHDMLHQGILPHHTMWAQFSENLKFIVIDEIHSYRGVFGSHLAKGSVRNSGSRVVDVARPRSLAVTRRRGAVSVQLAHPGACVPGLKSLLSNAPPA
jgi:DEAD/DEAH box helicase domain-containing protein